VDEIEPTSKIPGSDVNQGLTFGTISALFGLNAGIIDDTQSSSLVAVVVLSAVVPTAIAERWFLPDPERERHEERRHAPFPGRGVRVAPARVEYINGCVTRSDNYSRTQNGHIRNDTRDASRRISTACNSPICRKNCAASDRACLVRNAMKKGLPG
jgi:hypothetical protein